jgi:coenzyme F420-0:L-glutamate ligase
MKVQAIETRIFSEGESLVDFIKENIKSLKEGSVVVVTSKIVALAEKRTVPYESEQQKAEVIEKEGTMTVQTKYVLFSVKDGMVMANAGVDASNADGKLILLPKNSFETANQLLGILKKQYGLKCLAVLITDSRTWPLRAGVVGVAEGYAGFKGIKDYRGQPDIFGRKFVFETTNVADSLSAAAVATMGEGNEQRPLAIIEDAEIEFTDKVDPSELKIPLEDDMYKHFFEGLDDATLQ